MKINVNKIRSQMICAQVTQSSLAELAGISRQSISTILARGTCSAVNVGRISKALGLDIREILEG